MKKDKHVKINLGRMEKESQGSAYYQRDLMMKMKKSHLWNNF